MRLSEVVADLESIDDTFCIVAKRPWSEDSEAQVVRLKDDFRVPEEALSGGYEYFLEVSVARDEALGGLGSQLSAEQRLEAIIFYAENDAYPEWLSELRE